MRHIRPSVTSVAHRRRAGHHRLRMKRRLRHEERSFRKAGAGVPIGLYWPYLVMFAGVAGATFDPFLMRRCIGIGAPDFLSGKAALVELGPGAICSPLLVTGGIGEWALFAAIWLPVPFLLRNRGWIRRHDAYWKAVRERENVARRARRARKRAERAEAASLASGQEEKPHSGSSPG